MINSMIRAAATRDSQIISAAPAASMRQIRNASRINHLRVRIHSRPQLNLLTGRRWPSESVVK
jgi:hypothetical protein